MNNKIFLVGGVVAIIVALWLVFSPEQKVTNYPSSGTNVIAFGDSLVEGVGASKGNDLPSQISRKVGVPILNAGVSGNTTEQGLARLETDVLSQDPKVVILLLGGNDYLRRIDKAQTFTNLQQMVDKIHQSGSIVLLLGVRGGLLRDTYKEDFDAFAKKNKVAYVPNVLDDVLGDNELMSDQIHPNDKGYAEIAERVAPVLKKVLK